MGIRGARRQVFADTTPDLKAVGMVWDRASALLTQIDTRLEFPTDPRLEEEWGLLRVLAKRMKAVMERIRKTCRNTEFIDWDYDLEDVDVLLLGTEERRRVRAENPEYFKLKDKLVADLGELAMVMARAEWQAMSLTGNLSTRHYKPKHPDSPAERKRGPVPMLDANGEPIKYMRGVTNSWDRLAITNKALLDMRREAKALEIKENAEKNRTDFNSVEDFVEADNDAEREGYDVGNNGAWSPSTSEL